MLKILYAASNCKGSYHSLKRFRETYGPFYDIKYAGFSSSLQNDHANWNLDALLDFRNKYQNVSFKNKNFPIFFQEIKNFAPDLVISDLEIYSSYVALELQIPLWQVSPLLLLQGVAEQYAKASKHYSWVLRRNFNNLAFLKNIMNNSDKLLVQSYLGDIETPPVLLPKFEWLRPNYQVAENTEATYSLQLADAYYSGKTISLKPDFSDRDSILAVHYNQLFSLEKPYKTTLQDNVYFLSQHLESF